MAYKKSYLTSFFFLEYIIYFIMSNFISNLLDIFSIFFNFSIDSRCPYVNIQPQKQEHIFVDGE
nr:MAG TPA: hypothetical protein [Caudoviricetes sp.]